MTFGKRVAGAAALGAAMLIGIVASPPAEAGYIVTLTQVGSNVVATGSGSIDLSGLTFGSNGSSVAAVVPSLAAIVTGPASSVEGEIYNGFTGPTSFGSGGFLEASSGGGDSVGIEPSLDYLVVPSGYVSGSALSDTSTYDNETFATLGVTPGTYVWSWGGARDDTFTIKIATAVPEPGSLALLATGLLGLGLVGFANRRRRPG